MLAARISGRECATCSPDRRLTLMAPDCTQTVLFVLQVIYLLIRLFEWLSSHDAPREILVVAPRPARLAFRS